MKVYLAGPINGCSNDECMGWREQVSHCIEVFADVIDPMDRDYRGQEAVRSREIVAFDIRDIKECDVVLVRYVRPSVGTAMETRMAYAELGKLVLVWADEGVRLSPWLTEHSTRITYSLEQTATVLREWAE